MDMLEERLVQLLSNAVELWDIMCGKVLCCMCHRKVFVKCLAQILAPAVRAQDLDASAVLLGDGPGLKRFVRLEDLVLGLEQVHNGIMGCIVCKGDEVVLPLHSGSGCWPPDISVNLVPEALGWDADVRLGHGDASGMCVDACLAVHFGCIGI